MNVLTRILASTTVVFGLSAGVSHAETIGASFHVFDDNFITVLRNGMIDHADRLDGVTLQVENANGDVGRQLDQIQSFIASGVDGLIVLPVDTDGTIAISELAAEAGIPLVYVNREPINVDDLPAKQAFIASDEIESGTMQTEEVCRILKEEGEGENAKIAVLQGELGNFAARVRTQDIKDVIATPDCSFMEIVAEQSGNWQRIEANDIVSNWLSSGLEFDAIIANNDEMAIGAIQAVKSAGADTDDYIIAGIDATVDGLAAMSAGDLDVTVFQDAAGQGAGGVDAVRSFLADESVDQKTYIPFQLVTPSNMTEFENRN